MYYFLVICKPCRQYIHDIHVAEEEVKVFPESCLPVSPIPEIKEFVQSEKVEKRKVSFFIKIFSGYELYHLI